MNANSDSKNNSNISPVVNFYKNKSIFLTGVTGFLGMVVLEKLLFECEDIKNIYVLIKPKNDKSIQERLASIFSTQAFERIKYKNADILKKVIPIAGNLLDQGIGLSENDTKTLQKEVSVVFHLAANINSTLPVMDAIKINTWGARHTVQLCKGMRQLSAFVYVSTAFSNVNKCLIDEKVYKTGCPLKSVFYAAEQLKDNSLVDCLIEGRPNTYTFSKALAEEVIASELGGVPVAILRPSIITSAVKDPLPNWVYGWNGANFVAMGVGKGLIRCWHGDSEAVCDVIPVDKVSNLSIVAAWDVYRIRGTNNGEAKVFNCCSGLQNPLTLGNLLGYHKTYGGKHYVKEGVFPATFLMVKNRLLYSILFLLIHTIPAYIIEGFQWLFSSKRRSLKMHRRIILMGKVFNYFSLNNFLFIDYNVRHLYLEIDENDKQIFDFSIKDIEWGVYNESYVLGMKKHLLRET